MGQLQELSHKNRTCACYIFSWSIELFTIYSPYEQVNGQNLEGMPQRTVSELLLQTRSPLCLLLYRQPKQGKVEETRYKQLHTYMYNNT